MSFRSRFLVLVGLVAVMAAGAMLAAALHRRAGGEQAGLPAEQGLLDVPVESYVVRERGAFEARLEEARRAGQAWAGDALLIALEYLGGLEAQAVGLVKRDDAGEAPARSTVTVVRDGLLDDSVRAIWNQLHLARGEDGAWELLEVREAYRCRRGHHQESFSGEFCL